MRRYWIRGLVLAGACWALPLGAAEDLSAAIAACRAEQDAAKRLECYDRQADRVTERATAAAAPVTPAAAATQGAEAAVAGTVAAAASSATPTASAPAAQAAATASAAPKPVTPEDKFGYGAGAMARADDQKKKEQGLDEMVATVTQVTQRQRGELVITLDNGQVWAQKAPESFRVKAGDQVRIKAGALKSFMMSVATSDRATRVTRVR